MYNVCCYRMDISPLFTDVNSLSLVYLDGKISNSCQRIDIIAFTCCKVEF